MTEILRFEMNVPAEVALKYAGPGKAIEGRYPKRLPREFLGTSSAFPVPGCSCTFGSDVFLEPAASYRVTQALAGAQRLTSSQQTLHHSLRESGILVSVDRGRQMVRVRRTLEGCPRQVLHLKATDLAGEFETPLGMPAEELI